MRRLELGVVLLLAAAVVSCGQAPTEFCDANPNDLACDGTVVSETEIWKLELEQLEDGSTSPYPRRGSITMRLLLNHTTQSDPTCEGHPAGESVTTFLADVEAFASRLQSPTSGTADGSWNCHGFAATVRLNDDTRFDLVSEHTGSPAEWSWGQSYDVSWTASARRGEFSLRRAEPHDFDHIRESHVDVLVQNLTGGEAWIELDHPDTIMNPFLIDYRIPSTAQVPVSGTLNISWPAHGARREQREVGVPPPVALAPRAAFVWGPGAQDDWYEVCFLAPDHGNQVQLIIHGNGPECSDGWLDTGLFVAAARSPLFIQAGTQSVQDTVTIVITAPDTVPGATTQLSAESTDPDVTVQMSSELLTVTVAPQASRGEHGLRVIGEMIQSGDVIYTDTTFLPVYVYDLDVSTAADTLWIAPGGSDTTSLLLDGQGYFSPVRFGTVNRPAGVAASFSPSQTDRFLGVGSVLTLSVGTAVGPGTYDLTICTTIVQDPLARCHPTPLVLVVLQNQLPSVTITSPADGAAYVAGTSIDFSGTATDPEDGALSGGALVWTSNLDGQVGTGNSFARTNLSTGTHTITLTATDSQGGSGSASVAISVTDPGGAACGGDFDLRLDFSPIQVARGGADAVAVFVDRVAGFTDQVELMVTPGSDGTLVSDVLSAAVFNPNPVDGNTGATTLSFTVNANLTVGQSYELTISGGSPLLEVDPQWCMIPITFEVVQ